MSFRGGQLTPAPSNRGGPEARSVPSVNGTPPVPEYDPGVIPFPLRLTHHQSKVDGSGRWPTARSVRSDETSNTIEDQALLASPRNVTPPIMFNMVGGRLAGSGGNQVPQNVYPRFDRVFPRLPWLTGAQPRPSAATQHDRQSDDSYVPMGRWPTWYTRSILHPSVWSRQLEVTGISANYGGNIFLESNQSANIPEESSTSLWLTNLPPDCTHQLLLGTIRGCGKIYAAVINPPVYAKDDYVRGGGASGAQHSTAASKLVFFDRAGLDKLMAKSQAGEFSVGGYVPRLRMNRIKSAPRPAGPQCRVLHIEGPSSVVNERYLGQFFQSKFKYELEGVLTLGQHGARTRQEWRFGSYRCQAESARQAINREKLRYNMSDEDRRVWSQVSVHFGVDPCARD
ncbi:uncharacterized protein F4807DRAFT_462401 [Annulohypoxylon truncatum]|uniref:uncharacterized protein n=1 Tax=Annulohypoxylon truncatum TaxID=327061 RepID=UPI0020086E75|nr:uncharacterized protein F4807DRAFT_462401 [Annulohypoxylon truncatum]KAI1207592.1 hypothetical protein F4807DRAFT_462401 [Annulohypoxylon truncatum]